MGGDLDQAAAKGRGFEERKTGSQAGEGHPRPQTEVPCAHQF